jgi:hypothetical protein
MLQDPQPPPTEANPSGDSVAYIPTSEIVTSLLRDVPSNRVTLAWIVARLRDRSFGIVMLLIALIGIVPGVGIISAALLALVAV